LAFSAAVPPRGGSPAPGFGGGSPAPAPRFGGGSPGGWWFSRRRGSANRRSTDLRQEAETRAKAPAKLRRGAKPKPDKKDDKPPPGTLAFITNWELSAARALTVVHYRTRRSSIRAAVAFGQYRPVSKVKAKNRRIEIVLHPRVAITPK
jgi:hypothetical protein